MCIIMTEQERVIMLIDMDCFYCQVEEKLNPDLKGKPIGVVQYNQWRGGGLVAVNYLARAQGVTRQMRGDDAKKKCPNIELISIPCIRGKADLSKYREAGKNVASVLQEFTPLLERASIDEAYLDITELVVKRNLNKDELLNNINNLESTYILGYENVSTYISTIISSNESDNYLTAPRLKFSVNLLIGAIIASEIRLAVYNKTGFKCSAGIAHNKILAKLICCLNKPNKQTILPKESLQNFLQSLPINKIRSLGGKFGESICNHLNITTMGELKNYSEKELQQKFDEKNGSWLYNIARGINNEPVIPRFNSKSIGCCKKFPGKNAISDLTTLTHWLKELGKEIEERLKIDFLENNRYPTQFTISFTKCLEERDVSCSRSVTMSQEDIMNSEALALNGLSLIRKELKPFCHTEIHKSSEGIDIVKIMLSSNIKYLGISVGKFENKIKNEVKKRNSIKTFFNQNKINENEKSNETVNTLNGPSTSNVSTPINEKAHEIQFHEQIQKTKNIMQESFIINYLKTFKEGNISSYKANDFKSPLQDDQQENTNDSDCSIELEINKSKLLNNIQDDNRENIDQLKKSFSLPHKKFTSGEDSTESNIINCDQCDSAIPLDEYDIHKDYHFALSLKENRVVNIDLNSQISKSNEMNSPNKKKKRHVSNVKTHNIINLFRNIKNEFETQDLINSKVCPECNKNIINTKFTEHMDYHEAKKLHAELNKPLITINNEISRENKKKHSHKKNPKTQNSIKVKKINSYFKN